MDKKKQNILFYLTVVVLLVILVAVIWLVFFKKSEVLVVNTETKEQITEVSPRQEVAAPVETEMNPTVASPRKLRAYNVYDNVTNEITLRPQYGNKYYPENLFDGKRSTAWVVGDKEFASYRNRTGSSYASINIGFDGHKLDHIMIRNGYGKSSKHFSMNARPRWIHVSAYKNGGVESEGTLYEGALRDTNSPQRIDFADLGNDYDYILISFDKYDTYPGTKYQDVCIDEITLYGN